MKRVVIGTAGHVDHGKTSLIKALTGIDCDRLKEEKERGLTIELGFASMLLPSGERVGVVDVPGHVRFIRHMLSGASGIDFVLLVIAADEGVMPQTREHVQICELLGIRRGIVALTKIDLVDEDLKELALTDIEEFLDTTFLASAPIIPVSSTTGEGLQSLMDELNTQVEQVHERIASGIPILPVDRVFTIKGFGTVVTGTLTRGTFIENQEVEVLPGGRKAKIRNLQVHDHDVSQAMAGMRTAVNLQGVGVEDIARGEWVVPAGMFTPTSVIDAELKLIGRPTRGGIKLHIGATEVSGEMRVYDSDGASVARIRLKQPIIASHGDRFIVRNISPSVTIGGGRVLNPHPVRRFSAHGIQDLMSEDDIRRIIGIARDAGMHGISRSDLRATFPELGGRLDKLLQDLLSSGEITRYDAAGDLCVHASHAAKLKELVTSVVTEFHSRNPSSPGISREHLRSSLKGNVDPKLFHKVLQDLVKKNELAESGPNITLPGFRASLGDRLEGMSEQVLSLLEAGGFEPPTNSEIAEKIRSSPKDVDEILRFLVSRGTVVKIKDDMYLSAAYETRLKKAVQEFIVKNTSLAPTDMKALIGVSRKFAIPYLEYLDRIHFTMRIDNVRKLAGSR
ncbi:MAG: selenocysteine-specific translation elongation factor [Desulfomonilia bacterium]